MSDFVHLHVHSHYSLLDGLGKIDELVKRAQELEMSALALTDHGNMHGAIEFYTKCKKAGIKPILGVEAYLAPRGMEDKVPKVDSQAFHQILLAKDDVGYKNLLFLVSEAHTRGMYYKPRIDLELLSKHAKGLIATSSCLAGMIPEAIVAGDMEKALELTKRFQEMFDGNFFLELQHHPSLDKQIQVNDALKKIANELKIPLIATSDVHYVKPEDKETQELLLAINTGKDLASDDRMTFGDVDVSMHSQSHFEAAFADVPEVVTNTKKIADMVELELTLGQNIIPEFETPEGFTPDTYLEHLAWEGLKRRYTPITDEHKTRLEFELQTITKMGFASYFLIVADYVNWARSQNIYIGPGRGSAAGSIASYSLGITDMDPLPYGFLFERFLNPDRISMPDIDMDFADDDRDKVIRYVTEKYGADHVAGIATFGTMMGRAAVRDVARVLNVPYGDADALAKLVPAPVQGRHTPLKESIKNVSELKAIYDTNPTLKKVLDFATKLEGTVRHASQHACAFVICKDPTITYTPVQPAQRGREGLVTQYSMKPIEEVGLLKMDFLGLSNLTIMRNATRIIRKVYQNDLDIHNLPLDDTKTYELLSRGETTGVFQLESDGMKRYIKELKPTEFNDIIAMCALYRPGPMANIPTYIARKHGKEQVEYLHPKLANAFAKTYGIPVYQEQVMQAAKDLAGFTGGEADTLRKAMGKKIAALMKEMKQKFIDGCKVHSAIDEPLAEKIWKEFEEFSAYGFVLAHAGCYAMIAYQTAYLKANYPAAFFAALLTSNADNLEKMAVEMQEAEKIGIKILPPDVNESFPEFGVIKNELRITNDELRRGNNHNAISGGEYIRFGLAAIKTVGYGVAEKIVDERKQNGPFQSLTDFLNRLGPGVLNKRVLEALSMTGALDRFGERNSLVQSVETMVKFMAAGKRSSDQMGLFGNDTSILQSMALIDIEPVEKRTALEWEKQLLGIYLSGHPLKEIEHILPHIATPIKDILGSHEGQNRRIGGIVSELRSITTKSNEQMAFVKIIDNSGTLEVVVFPRNWAEVKSFCQIDRYVIVDGRVDNRDNQVKLIASRILELHPEESVAAIKAALGPLPTVPAWQKKKTSLSSQTGEAKRLPDQGSRSSAPSEARLILKMPSSMSKKALEEIRYILQAHTGTIPVFIETMRGSDFTVAKTKSAVAPHPDLLAHLKQAGVEAVFEGVKVVQPLPPEPADDLPPPFFEEEFVEDPELAIAE